VLDNNLWWLVSTSRSDRVEFRRGLGWGPNLTKPVPWSRLSWLSGEC
jgi:hypothetical protein